MGDLIGWVQGTSDTVKVIVGAAAIAGVAWRTFGVPALRRSRAAVRRIRAVLELVEAQLNPNGGSSLTDMVRATRACQEELRAGQIAVVGRLDKVDRRLAAGERRFEKLEAAQAATMQSGEGARSPSARTSPGEEEGV